MITRTEAEEIAAGWARRESVRRGYECTPMLSEFDLGFVVWTRQPTGVLPIPGDGVTTVIDRATGRLSTWPGVPSGVVEELYRERRDTVVGPELTADPEVELRRNAVRRASPAVAAHITLDGRLVIARGAKGDQQLRHHRLVAEHLGNAAAGRLVRGAERHAELIALSDVLHEVDRRRRLDGRPPVSLVEARELLGGARLEVFHIREPRDPLGGQPMRPCESCIVALVDFGLLPWPQLAFAEERRPAGQDPAQPGRFPDKVAAVLADGGWHPQPEFVGEALAGSMIEEVLEVAGQEHRHVPFPAATAALADFPGLVCGRRGPGERQWIRVFQIAPMAAAQSADLLAEFGAVLGNRLFPLGTEARGETILAIDEQGRVFALDQAGEWLIGEDIDAALINLITGGATPRVRDDGTW